MKTHTEMNEGPEAFKRFDTAMGALLSVSHDELMRREAEYKKKGKNILDLPNVLDWADVTGQHMF